MILRRNYLDATPQSIPVPPRNNLDPSTQEYQLLLQFDLKRQKQKNLILEERLKNKQNFIQQMKHFQQELTLAYEGCKNQLIIAQQKIQYLQNVQFREYTEQIADLKHMLLMKTQESKRNSIGKEDKTIIIDKIGKNRSQKAINYKSVERRQSRTSSNYATQRERSVNDRIQHQISRQLKKSANFIGHFLQMTECYMSELRGEQKLTKRLKKSWKWIKEVVKQWDNLKQTAKSSIRFRQELSQLFQVSKETTWSEYLQIIREALQNVK